LVSKLKSVTQGGIKDPKFEGLSRHDEPMDGHDHDQPRVIVRITKEVQVV